MTTAARRREQFCRWLAAAATASVVVAGASSCAPSGLQPTASSSTPPAASSSPAATTGGFQAGQLSLLVEPDQGISPVDALIAAARRSVDLTMYELVDSTAEAALVAAAGRGVDVRVLLDVSREKQANQAAYTMLNAHGVHASWADTRYSATHEKALVVDDQLAAIMTLNLTSRYYATTRDYAVLDRDPVDVAAIEAVFDADVAHRTVRASPGDHLVWSPGSQQALLDLIASARTSLLVENEEIASAAVVSALAKAASRGVRVELVMTDESDWHGAFETLAKAGVAVRSYAQNARLYIHAKAIVVDPGSATARAFVGSENFSAASMNHNRELGLVLSDPTIVGSLASVISSDATGGRPWHV